MGLLIQLRQKLSQGFSAAWNLWPRKDKKLDAQKAWNQKVTTPEIEEKVFDALTWQVPILEEREPKYRPLFASWLRGEEWNNERPAPKRTTINPPTVMALQQLDAASRIRSLVATGMSLEEAKQIVNKEMGWVKE